MSKRHQALPILNITEEFFTSPMWADTIKDYVLANCQIFTGGDEFDLAHLECHKKFCEIIENTLNIYLLDVLGISFDQFQDAVLASAKHPDAIATKVLTILKQATDFKYFAAKMYAYNLMLDREAQQTFLIEGDDARAFFITEGATKEAEETKTLETIAVADLNDMERKMGLPPSGIELPAKKAPASKLPPMEAKPEVQQKKLTASDIPKISPEERERIKRQIQREKQQLAQSIDQAEVQRRKEEFQKRREMLQQRKAEIVQKKREECQEQIQLNLQKHPKPVVQPEEDPTEALRRALAMRVKDVINETE